MADFDRWAESLEDNTIRCWRKSGDAVAKRRVSVYPWKRATPVDYQITVQVSRFDRMENGESVAQAHDGACSTVVAGCCRGHRPTGRLRPGRYAATVTAMNRNLETFSRDVALKIEALSTGSGR